jgi:hypothetical protein
MDHRMGVWMAIGVAIFASLTGAFAAIFIPLLARQARTARRAQASVSVPRSAASWFVSAALFAGMAGALVYQGVSRDIPPDFIGAAIFACGCGISLVMCWRRRGG